MLHRLAVGLLCLGLLACAPADRDSTESGGFDALGFSLLQAAPRGENLVTSPISLAIALSMIGEGTSPEAETELAELMALTRDERRLVIQALGRQLAAHDGDPGRFDAAKAPRSPFLHLANNVVIDEGVAIKQDYLDVLKADYDAPASVVELDGDAGKQVLDQWVAEHTAGLIKQSAIKPSPELALVLQSAILFGASWEAPFASSDTTSGAFTTPDGEVEVEMLRGRKSVAYAEQSGWSAIVLPYTEGFQAIIILPPDGTDPASLDESTRDKLLDKLRTVEPQTVVVSMPKVDIASRTNLVPLLKAQGLEAIFTDKAALSGMSDAKLVVGQFWQQGVLLVDEEGTVAAAVTEAGMEPTSAPVQQQQFLVDRPYLFVVEHIESSADLFQAVINDPQPK